MQVNEGSKVIELNDSERTRCEIWTRVMGYYRTTDDMNIGKRQEHKDRKPYRESIAMQHYQ
jgi:anaerobic ribonucleoside-triphosphate reductase